MNAPMLAATLTAASQNGPHVSGGSKAGAVLIGVAVLIVLYAVTAFITHHWNPVDLFRGFDGVASTSKLQWFLWLIVILFAYAALWVNTTDLRCSGSREAVTWGFLPGCGMVPGVFCSREGLLVGVGYRIRARPGVPRAFLPACRR